MVDLLMLITPLQNQYRTKVKIPCVSCWQGDWATSRGRPRRRMFPAVGFPCGARDAGWRAAFSLLLFPVLNYRDSGPLFFSRYKLSYRVKSVDGQARATKVISHERVDVVR